MLCRICSRNGGAVPLTVTALLSLVMILSAVALLGAAKISADCEPADDTVTVTLTADGCDWLIRTKEMTVGKLLDRSGVDIGCNDEVIPSADTLVCEGMAITVKRVEYRTREKSTFIPYETEYTETPLLKMGDSEVRVEGVNGEVTITIEDKFVDGVLVSSEQISAETADPVTEVIAQGTALQTPYSKREGNYRLVNGIPEAYAYKLSGKVTSYTAPEGSGTYSGRPLVIGSVGVDPDVIPFGSEVYIVSQDGRKVYGYAVASDTGDITDIIADAYMGVTSEHWDDAMNWCAQYCDVYVLTVGDNSVSWR